MDFFQALTTCFKKYATFEGRARRAEYWYWWLFVVLALMILPFVDMALFHVDVHDHQAIYPLKTIFSLATLVPSTAVAARRLHDIDKSGWWLLLELTIIGAIFPLLFWLCRKGTVGHNRFGPDPLAV